MTFCNTAKKSAIASAGGLPGGLLRQYSAVAVAAAAAAAAAVAAAAVAPSLLLLLLLLLLLSSWMRGRARAELS